MNYLTTNINATKFNNCFTDQYNLYYCMNYIFNNLAEKSYTLEEVNAEELFLTFENGDTQHYHYYEFEEFVIVSNEANLSCEFFIVKYNSDKYLDKDIIKIKSFDSDVVEKYIKLDYLINKLEEYEVEGVSFLTTPEIVSRDDIKDMEFTHQSIFDYRTTLYNEDYYVTVVYDKFNNTETIKKYYYGYLITKDYHEYTAIRKRLERTNDYCDEVRWLTPVLDKKAIKKALCDMIDKMPESFVIEECSVHNGIFENVANLSIKMVCPNEDTEEFNNYWRTKISKDIEFWS